MQYYRVPKPLALIGLASILFFTALNLVGIVAQVRSLRAIDSVSHYTYVDSDFPSSIPIDLRPVALTVEKTNRYALTSSSDWGSLFPAGNGWVRLGPDGRLFAVSMYHQLHCLNAMRHALVQAREVAGLHFYDPESSTDPVNGNATMHMHGKRARKLHPETPLQAFSHADHCFNYLRQAILCAADTTIEASQPKVRPDGKNDSGASGFGMTHTCRDWTQVREYLDENDREWRESHDGRS